ncbi:hypothetical protein B0E33_12865 [Roseibium algicola]|uniref:Uncharacterized protein n=1 Tax=Roseibium algicola TaxID=2857014 RepID=A0ABN4X0H0_9HYPH|nr:hypothetical protein B0E33_12865 [Roseibium aggregatum]
MEFSGAPLTALVRFFTPVTEPSLHDRGTAFSRLVLMPINLVIPAQAGIQYSLGSRGFPRLISRRTGSRSCR